jgi:hypothetical protein
MKKILILSVFAVLLAAQAVQAHDPRTVARDFSHTLSIEGAGKFTISWKSLHWNEPTYLNAKKNDQLRQRLNNGLWKKIGKVDTDFDIVIGGNQVAKGSYDLGITFGAADDFALVLRGAGKEMTIPLKTTNEASEVTYLSFDLRPASDTDAFIIEGRSGKFRCSTDVKVPYLSDTHEHKK